MLACSGVTEDHAEGSALDGWGRSPRPTKGLLLTFGGGLLTFGALKTPPPPPPRPALPGNPGGPPAAGSIAEQICLLSFFFSLISIAAANDLLKFKSADDTIFVFFPPRSPPGSRRAKREKKENRK